MSLKNELDPNIKPGDDLFRHVNGKWIAANPIPDDQSQWDMMTILNLDNLKKLHDLLEAEIDPTEPLMNQLVKQYYKSAMDEAEIQKATESIVKDITHEVKKLSSSADLASYITHCHQQGIGLLWNLVIEPDDKNSLRYLTRLWQGGLSLPEKSYYLEDSEEMKQIRAKYLDYLTRLIELIGEKNAPERAKKILDLETDLAKISNSAVENRDIEKLYNLVASSELATDHGHMDWPAYLSSIGLGKPAEVIISQPKYFRELMKLLEDRPLESWKDYLLVHRIGALASKLSKDYEELVFDFFARTLRGTQEMEPRHLRSIRACLAMLPEPTGRLYVEHYFNEEAKASIQDLVDHILKAFRNRLEKLEWMKPETKQKAYAKLDTFLPLLGYPDKWKDFGDLKLGHIYAQNWDAINQFSWDFEAKKLNGPVDKTEWFMSPALVNAYYWPNSNGITFPAGILQSPFFDPKGDLASNYGGIGAVIGHEITHGFDDEGSKFDKDGNMKAWWSDEDRQAFEDRAAQLEKQYSKYKLYGRHVDGKLTLGENIADLGGVLVAFDAYLTKIKESGENKLVDGMTPEQRFFAAYAKTWRGHDRKELTLQLLVRDPHSPDIFRVNGVVPNIDKFYDAFDVEIDQKLYIKPDERVRIW